MRKGRFLARRPAILWAAMALAVTGLAGTSLHAQTPAQQFAEADWFEREIGEGVVWRNHMFENLFGFRQHVSILEADLSNPAVEVIIPHIPTGLQRTTQMTPAQFADAVGSVNGTYFASGGHNTYLRIDGTEIPHQTRSKGAWGHNAGFIKDSGGDWGVAKMPTTGGEWDDDTDSLTIMGNGPMLVWDGSVDQAAIDVITSTHCTSLRSRTAVGITADNRVILMTVDEGNSRSRGVSCTQMGELMILLGVTDAVNLDGGGSVTMWVADEPNNGLANFLPSGAAERSVANALGFASDPADPAEWDARLMSVSYNNTVEPGDTQTVTFVYQNIGTETWTAADTRFVTSRPIERASALYDSETWVSSSQPAVMSPATVAPGGTATFSFSVTTPESQTAQNFEEFFMLTQQGVGRIGPGDHRALLAIASIPATPTGPTIIVESRSGGLNYAWYSDAGQGFSDSSANNRAPGTTSENAAATSGGIGSRWTSTFTSNAAIGVRQATWRPNFTEGGEYAVAVSWPEAGTLRRTPILYHVDHVNGRTSVEIDQTAPGDQWYPLGTFTFDPGQSDDGRVIMSNEITDQSGNMWAGAVRFVLIDVETSADDNWSLYQ